MARPVHCSKRMPVAGTTSSVNGSRPSVLSHSARASCTGSDGAAKGSLAMKTVSHKRPGKSKPSPKDCRPKITEGKAASTRA